MFSNVSTSKVFLHLRRSFKTNKLFSSELYTVFSSFHQLSFNRTETEEKEAYSVHHHHHHPKKKKKKKERKKERKKEEEEERKKGRKKERKKRKKKKKKKKERKKERIFMTQVSLRLFLRQYMAK